MRGHFENLFREVVDAIEKAASARDENTSAQVINEWIFIKPAFELLKGFAQAHVNNRIQSLALDVLPGKTGIVL